MLRLCSLENVLSKLKVLLRSLGYDSWRWARFCELLLKELQQYARLLSGQSNVQATLEAVELIKTIR